MPGIVGFPTVVEDAVEEFRATFANAPERRHFGEISDRADGGRTQEQYRLESFGPEFVDITDQMYAFESAWMYASGMLLG